MDSFSSLMEFAVAIAGFSGITMAVQARDAVINEVQSFRNANLIAFSLAAAFASVVPNACEHLGATGFQLWAWSSVVFAVICGALLALPLSFRKVLSQASRAQLSPFIWFASMGGTSVVLACQVLNAVGAFGESGSAPIYVGIVWLIALAALMYARMLLALRPSLGGS